MYKISLINMPFANVALPSIALTQLKSVAEERFGDRVRVRILYLNLDFSHFVGTELYEMMTSSMAANNSGLGDWFFRQLAFPDAPDNTDTYFHRYFPHVDAALEERKGQVLARRSRLPRFMERLIAKHRLDEEDLVGLTSMFAQNVASMAMARMIKQRRPEVVTILGGANCEAPMGPTLARHVDALDFVAAGPALATFPELLEHLLSGARERCHEIRGIYSRTNVERFTTGLYPMGTELPIEVPVSLDYDSYLEDLDRSFPAGQVEPSLTFETSRGCWWGERSHCTFCGLNGTTMAYRGMPPAQARELFRSLFARYGDRCRRYESVDNIMPREYLKEVFNDFQRPPGSVLFYEVKADLKAWEMDVLARAGVTEIQPGIEALATSTLKLMRKGTTSFQNLNFLKNCLTYGIKPQWNLLIGFPGESEEVYKKYLDDMPRMVHLPPPSGSFPVRFDRYSPYFVKADAYGLQLSPYDFYRFIYPFDEEVLARIAYFFEDRNYDSEYMVQMITWQDKLNRGVTAWRQRYTGADGRPKAELRLDRRDGRLIVNDTREGELRIHELSDVDGKLLELVQSKGWNAEFLERHLGVDRDEVGRRVTRLLELGLLFEENERYFSLVMAPAAVWKKATRLRVPCSARKRRSSAAARPMPADRTREGGGGNDG
ncbi:MAG: RiPP maturation radical SAM protein 1 [Thermoanaerobaculia bacterium]|nr:RiPP maturation radical SAM protein 1 [Thermoanaerobaculia bacterium]